MRLLITLLSIFAFGLHILLGCCAHHAHAASEDSGAGPLTCNHAVAHDYHPGHQHAHEHFAAQTSDSQPSDHSQRGPQHDDCHESHCTFIAADDTPLDVDLPSTPLPAVASGAFTAQAATAALRWLADTGDPLPLPVRLHLYHQLWLN